MKYRKKPIVIDAAQLTWATWPDVCELVGTTPFKTFVGGIFTDGSYFWGDSAESKVGDGVAIAAKIETLEGDMIANENDWIIRGVAGELYPCKPDIFLATYELVEPTIKSEPKCMECLEPLSIGVSQNGKPTYFCINTFCTNRFKTVYAGASSTSEGRPNTAA